MTDYPAEFKEETSSQIPALQLLINMGYSYLRPDEALALRGGKTGNVILTDVLEPWLREHNTCAFKNQPVPFSDSNIRTALNRLSDIDYGQGMYPVNQDMYDNVLMQGISLEQTIDGNRRSYSLEYVDWLHPENNVYHVTDEFSVQRRKTNSPYRPDIVLFVNGIPLVVIECKRSDLATSGSEKPVFQGITQHLRNQDWQDGIPSLYVYAQLLFSVAVDDARYAVTGTKAKFWSLWQEEDDIHDIVSDLIHEPLSSPDKQKLYGHRPYAYRIQDYFDSLLEKGRIPTQQDTTIYAMLRPERLLELCYQFIVFDNTIKKIARYQQYFAIRETLERVVHRSGESRQGGVIWHTTGSGKSLTMVMLAKALALYPSISNPRMILVTDRITLDKQISDTFNACGKTAYRAKSGDNLGKLIKDSSKDIITTIIDKFETTAKRAILDESADIFVLVDESHRGQYGTSHARMKQVFPNACYIGFTGTPLLKKDYETARKFGGFIHKYTMRQAVADGAVVPLLYEGRIADMELNHDQLDLWFERRTKTLTPEQQADLKRKMSRSDEVHRVAQRINYIAYDIAEHFKANVDRGMKGQLATPSKEVGFMYRQALRDNDINCELMISPPDTREGTIEVGQLNRQPIQQFWRDMTALYGNERNYNDSIRGQFEDPEGLDIVIVVDKWLVGFDEPRNAVLYIDKPLKEHGLLQAIARVNRLFEGKAHGLIIDYRGVLGELNNAMDMYDALEGFDIDDVAGTITDVSVVIDQLPQHHQQLLDVFKSVDNMQDLAQLVELLEPENIRDHFYEMLNQFASTLKVALGSEIFYETVSDTQIKRYKNDLKTYHNLRQTVQHRYAEIIDYDEYEDKVRKLMHTHIGVTGVTTLTALVNIFDEEAFADEVARVHGANAKADTILYRLKKTITDNMDSNPALYEKFSKMIDDTIQAFRDGRIDEIDKLKTANTLNDAVQRGYVDDTPESLRQNGSALAYYETMSKTLDEAQINGDSDDFVTIALQIDRVIQQLSQRDWQYNKIIQNKMFDAMEDILFDSGLQLEGAVIDSMTKQIMKVAISRA